MKKKLLFSLLLGSAFSWMNGMYAATDVKVDAAGAKEKPAEAGKEAAPKVAAKVYKATDLDGTVKNVTFFKDEGYTGATKPLKFQDGGTYDPTGKKNFPYMAGEEMPKGHAVVYVLRKEGSDNELKFVSADGSPKAAGYTNVPAEWWMYFDGERLYAYEEKPDANATLILGKKASIYEYQVPDKEKEALKAEVEAAKKSGGGTAAPVVNSAGNAEAAELLKGIKASEASMAESIEKLKQLSLTLGANANNGSALSQVFTVNGVQFVITSTDPEALKNPDLFATLVANAKELFSTRPSVFTALTKMLIPPQVTGEIAGLSKVSLADILKKDGADVTISADLSFGTGVTHEAAIAFLKALMGEYGTDKQAVPAASTVPLAPALVAPVASSSTVIPSGLSPTAQALLESRSKLRKVGTGTAAAEITREQEKVTAREKVATREAELTAKAELAAAEAEKAELEAKLKATEAVAASALEAAQKNQAEEYANAAKLKETLTQANAIIAAKEAETAQVVANANAIIQQKDAQNAQVVANANAIIQQTEAEKNKAEQEKAQLLETHADVKDQLAKKEAELSGAHGALTDIAKANANPAPTTPIAVQEKVHEDAAKEVAKVEVTPTVTPAPVAAATNEAPKDATPPAPVVVQEQSHVAPAKEVVTTPTPVAAHEAPKDATPAPVVAANKEASKDATPAPDAAKKVEATPPVTPAAVHENVHAPAAKVEATAKEVTPTTPAPAPDANKKPTKAEKKAAAAAKVVPATTPAPDAVKAK